MNSGIAELLKSIKLRYSRSIKFNNEQISNDVIAQLHKFKFLKDRNAYACMSLDAKYPGAGVAYARKILFKDELRKESVDVFRFNSAYVDTTIDEMYVGSERRFVEDVFKRSFLSGGTMTISTHDLDVPILTELDSCTFEVVVLASADVQSVDPIVVVYDGSIESVSEVDRVLRNAAEVNVDTHVFCTRCSLDVVSTVKLNNASKKFRVWLYEYEKGIENVNDPKDVAICCATNPITSAEGRTLSMVSVSEYPRVDKIVVGESRVSISNSRSDESRNSFVTSLMSSRVSAENEYSASALERRIKRFVSKGIELRIRKEDPLRNEISQLSREFNSMYAHGCVRDVGKLFFPRTYHPYAAYEAVKNIADDDDSFYL